jgi:integrase
MGAVRKVESAASTRAGKGARYRADWRDPQGRKHAKTFATKKEALHHLATVEGDKARGTYVDPKGARLRFGDYANTYVDSQQWRPSTRALVASYLKNHVLPALADRPIGAIRRSEVQGFVTGLTAKLAPATVETVYTIVSCIFRSAVRDRVIIDSPCDHISLPEVVKKEVQFLTRDQVSSLTEHMHPRFRALVSVGVGTGLRPGEIFGLRVPRIDFLRRRLSVVEQVQTLSGQPPCFAPLKTKASQRIVPLPPFVIDALSLHLAEYPSSDVVFTTPEGALINRTRFHERFWTPARIAAGLPASITPHSMRHTYVSALIGQGTHPKAIQALVGHASITTTMDEYGHLFPESNEQTNAALENFFGPSADKLPTNNEAKFRLNA